MGGFTEMLGLFICLGPIVAIIVVLALATRRSRCRNCEYAVSSKDTTCPHCGCSLTPPDEP